jgi:glycine oxidase
MQQADIAIAGAGIIGLSAALELASAGLRVVVFERGQAMRECSWAAAGMLAAADPGHPAALRPLSTLSLSLYPEFLAKVEYLSGQRVPIRTTQTLLDSHTQPPGCEQLNDKTIHTFGSGLRSNGHKFFLLEEQSLDPRDLVRSLPQAVRASGVTLLEQSTVTSITPQLNSVQIQTTGGEWSATHFINACGAWASDLAGIPIAPRKGQMLLVETPEKQTPDQTPEQQTPGQLTAVIRTPDLYLVPRRNGRIAIGATVEDVGFDKHIDPAAIAALHRAAAELWPPIANARIIDTWAGLRPAATDFLPVIGPAIDIDEGNGSRGSSPDLHSPDLHSPDLHSPDPHSWLALGHFRNGILLAPGTARLLRQMILKERMSIDAAPYSALRFVASAVP